MQHKFRLFILVMIFSLVATQVMADNEILAPDDNCPDTMQYLPAGMDVHYAPRINPGVVSNGYVDPSVITNIHTMYMAFLQAEIPTSSLLTQELDEIGEAPTPIQLTGNYYCASDGITAVFREVQSNGQTQWIIEAIFIEELVLTDDIIADFTTELLEPLEMAPEDNPQVQFLPPATIGDREAPDDPVQPLDVQVPDTTPVLSNAGFYFWEIYDITPYDGPDSVQTNVDPAPQPHQYCDDYTAISYLSVGMEARMAGYYYSRYSNEGSLESDNRSNWLDLGDPMFGSQYAFDFYQDMQETNMYEPAPTNFNTDIMFYGGAELVMSHGVIFAPPMLDAPVATIIDGPDCQTYQIRNHQECTNSNPCEAGADPDDRYVIWWEIEVTVHGETYVGWYPENVTQYAWWTYEDYGWFDQAATAYLLTPMGEAMTIMGEDTCGTLPASRYATGTDVQPATGAMNIRDTANGDVIGRVEADSVMTLVGEPECEDGVRWREVIFHDGSVERGWIAENDDTVFYITTYVPPVETAEPDSTREPDNSGGSNNNPQTTREPDDPTGGSGSSTRPTATPEPVVPIRATQSSCDPATGRGC